MLPRIRHRPQTRTTMTTTSKDAFQTPAKLCNVPIPLMILTSCTNADPEILQVPTTVRGGRTKYMREKKPLQKKYWSAPSPSSPRPVRPAMGHGRHYAVTIPHDTSNRAPPIDQRTILTQVPLEGPGCSSVPSLCGCSDAPDSLRYPGATGELTSIPTTSPAAVCPTCLSLGP